jgi:hypothetical protein
MSILIILGIISVICSLVVLLAKECGDFFPIVNFISFLLLFAFLIVGFSFKVKYTIEKMNYIVLQNSLEDLKKEEGKLRNTFTTSAIIDMNRTLAGAKYLETTVFKIFIPDEFSYKDYLR